MDVSRERGGGRGERGRDLAKKDEVTGVSGRRKARGGY